jgi:hypothetical protein
MGGSCVTNVNVEQGSQQRICITDDYRKTETNAELLGFWTLSILQYSES